MYDYSIFHQSLSGTYYMPDTILISWGYFIEHARQKHLSSGVYVLVGDDTQSTRGVMPSAPASGVGCGGKDVRTLWGGVSGL